MKAPTTSGNTIGIFAPASPFDQDRFDKGVRILEELGYRIHLSPHLTEKHGYLAGDDDTRIAAFHQLLRDDRVDILMAVRGGYGVHRIVDRIDEDLLLAANKPIVGFSDITALHAVAWRAGLISIHGPVVTQLCDLGPSDHQHLKSVLSSIEDLTYEGDTVITSGNASGRLVGGCLSVIAPLLGSELLTIPQNAILLLEEVGEAPYRVDRLLTQLRLAGVLGAGPFQGRVRGVAVGDFVSCTNKTGEQTLSEVLEDRLGDLGIPVLAGLPFGHGSRNLAVPLGARVTLDTSERKLTVHGP